MVKQALLIVGCVAGLGLQACNNNAADPAQVEAEVQKAKAEGEKKIVEAQAKLEQVAAENKKDVVVAQADARIDAANDSAAKAGDSAKTAEAGKPEAGEPAAPPADENVAKARVAAMQKVADAQYGVEKAKAEATYGVTLARCMGQSSQSMQLVCRDGAQKTLASAVASAKARNDAARRRAAMAQTGGQNG
jgi:hypothetical protein